jgi:Rad3-related DNA helicase
MPSAVRAIEHILDLFPNKKGLIHSNSFTINNYILDTISKEHHLRFTSHRGERGKTYQDALSEHLEADYPSVLMSPSVIEGVDLPGTQSEFQIIFRLFYENEEDSPQMKARHAIDPHHREVLAAIKLIQSSFRSLRSSQDICPTFILDSRFGYFVKRNSDIIHSWWRDAIIPTPHNYSYISTLVKPKTPKITIGV